jgi:hypothetical protein
MVKLPVHQLALLGLGLSAGVLDVEARVAGPRCFINQVARATLARLANDRGKRLSTLLAMTLLVSSRGPKARGDPCSVNAPAALDCHVGLRPPRSDRRKRLSTLLAVTKTKSSRGPKARGDPWGLNAPAALDCHVGLRPPRNDRRKRLSALLAMTEERGLALSSQ